MYRRTADKQEGLFDTIKYETGLVAEYREIARSRGEWAPSNEDRETFFLYTRLLFGEIKRGVRFELDKWYEFRATFFERKDDQAQQDDWFRGDLTLLDYQCWCFKHPVNNDSQRGETNGIHDRQNPEPDQAPKA